MIDFEENKKILHQMELKLKELGDSLWHLKIRKYSKKFRKLNNRAKFLEW